MKRILFFVAVLLLSNSVYADSHAGSGPNPYVDCGIGAALFPDTHWAAVTSNVIWDIGTTAVISATASPETCQGAEVAAAIFIRDTYDELIEDTAKGSGEHATALLDIFSCARDDHASIVSEFRPEVGQILQSGQYQGLEHLDRSALVYQAVYRAVSSHCSAS